MDCAQDTGGHDNWIIKRSTLDAGSGNAALQIKSDLGPIRNVTVDGNFLNGGNYVIFSRDGGNGTPQGIKITNNRFGRNFRYGILSWSGDITWSGNRWADTGEPIGPGDDPGGGVVLGDSTTTTTGGTGPGNPTTTTTSPPLPSGEPEARILVSQASDRSNPSPLQNAKLSGVVYMFATPTDSVDQATFHIDDSPQPFQVEDRAPYDLAGTDMKTRDALPFDTGTLSDGKHSINVVFYESSGRQTAARHVFVVDNTTEPAERSATTTTTTPTTTTPTTVPVPTTQAHLDSPAVDEAVTAPTTSFRGEEPGVSPDTESSESYVVAESAVDPLVSGASFWTIMLETPRIGVISGLTIALLLMLVLGVLAERDRRLNRRLANAVPTVNESKSDPGPIDGRIWDDPRSS